jgi:trk system potassium uptake protein TrkA
MNIIVVGCGRVGAELAHRLLRKNHRVTVIDHASSAFNNLPPDFLGRTIEGDAMNQNVLERAGINEADGLAVVTNSDPLNAVVAHLAREAYKIENVVVRNYNPSLRGVLEAFNLQLISSSSWGAQRLEELLAHAEMHTVFSSGNGEVEVYEFGIPVSWHGHLLAELLPAENCLPVSITRAGSAIPPSLEETTLNADDIVLVSATFDGIEAVRKRLHTGPEA